MKKMKFSVMSSYAVLHKPLLILMLLLLSQNSMAQQSAVVNPDGAADRKVWVDVLTTIAMPVVQHLSEGNLKQNMPFESLSTDPDRREVSYLEALGRTICGIAPWLELGPDSSEEGQLREKMIQLSLQAITNAVDSTSSDYLRFTANRHAQPLVDAAFLAEGLLRAPKQLWGGLSEAAKQNLIREFKKSRSIKPYESNWLLFASIIEAALLEFTGECDMDRMMYGVEKFRNEWYKGDGWYGDGRDFHLDYYNSLVIHPMLTETLAVINKHGLQNADFYDTEKKRMGRYAEQLERMISPEGTYPVTGRSITYRFGSMHALSAAALLGLLPETLDPAQVRSGLTAVIKRQLMYPDTFDSNGWLTVGFTGSQIDMSEDYINTGSEYLICAGFCALGLPEDHPFWSRPYADWSARKAWNNQKMYRDHAL